MNKNLNQTIEAGGLTFARVAGSSSQIIAIISSLGNNLWVQKLIESVSWCRPLYFKFLGVLFSAAVKVKIYLSNSRIFHHYLFTKKIISRADLNRPPNPNSMKPAKEYPDPTNEDTFQCYIEWDPVQQFTKHIVSQNVSMDRDEMFLTKDLSLTMKGINAFCWALLVLRYMTITST